MIFLDRKMGILTQANVVSALKEVHVNKFFKEQIVETSLA
jgi:hypothetical protein